MIGLRYTGALRAQGLRQEAPPTADRAFWPGSWETSLQNHQTGRQHLPRATLVGGRRRRTLTPTCQPPWDPTARTVTVPAPPTLLRPDPEGCGRRPWAAGFHVTCTGWVEPAQDHPQPPCQSPPAQSQTVAGSGHDPRGPPCSPGGSTRPPPPADAAPCPAWCPGPRPRPRSPVWRRQGPEDSQAVLSGECWQPRYS